MLRSNPVEKRGAERAKLLRLRPEPGASSGFTAQRMDSRGDRSTLRAVALGRADSVIRSSPSSFAMLDARDAIDLPRGILLAEGYLELVVRDLRSVERNQKHRHTLVARLPSVLIRSSHASS